MLIQLDAREMKNKILDDLRKKRQRRWRNRSRRRRRRRKKLFEIVWHKQMLTRLFSLKLPFRQHLGNNNNFPEFNMIFSSSSCWILKPTTVNIKHQQQWQKKITHSYWIDEMMNRFAKRQHSVQQHNKMKMFEIFFDDTKRWDTNIYCTEERAIKQGKEENNMNRWLNIDVTFQFVTFCDRSSDDSDQKWATENNLRKRKNNSIDFKSIHCFYFLIFGVISFYFYRHKSLIGSTNEDGQWINRTKQKNQWQRRIKICARLSRQWIIQCASAVECQMIDNRQYRQKEIERARENEDERKKKNIK